jgi:hypothetical protein
MLAFPCHHCTAPLYPFAELSPVAGDDSRQRHQSVNMAAFVIPQSKHLTTGDSAFPVLRLEQFATSRVVISIIASIQVEIGDLELLPAHTCR